MDFKSEMRGAILVIAISGNLDALTAPALADAISTQLREDKTRVVANLAGLEYTSSAGLRVLLNGVKAARQQGGDLRLAGAQPDVNKVLELSGFTSIMKSFPDVETAVASFA
ncbi:MAG: hypothetical protein B6D41_14980 [Chloroflexi bacterium UTCFX4]|jgi:anti-anti-sigma factor|nr:MAG: hypothetical protein B6D41_14980 [Chloroflexi bacterium UTCFX4]